MAESSQHVFLIEAILGYIEGRFGNSSSFLIFSDLRSRLGGEKPPRIGGFVPDVYAQDVPHSTTIIGDAKTALDLTREHSRNQICAYLEHLRYQQNGILILAVPFFFAASARIVVNSSRRLLSLEPKEVEIVVLDEFQA